MSSILFEPLGGVVGLCGDDRKMLIQNRSWNAWLLTTSCAGLFELIFRDDIAKGGHKRSSGIVQQRLRSESASSSTPY